ncbi:hypothetical protein D3C71_1722880 [compost metagenome]
MATNSQPSDRKVPEKPAFATMNAPAAGDRTEARVCTMPWPDMYLPCFTGSRDRDASRDRQAGDRNAIANPLAALKSSRCQGTCA